MLNNIEIAYVMPSVRQSVCIYVAVLFCVELNSCYLKILVENYMLFMPLPIIDRCGRCMPSVRLGVHLVRFVSAIS